MHENWDTPRPSIVLSIIYGCHALFAGLVILASIVQWVSSILDRTILLSWFSSVIGIERDIDILWALFYTGVLVMFCCVVTFLCFASCTFITWIWRHSTRMGRFTAEHFSYLRYPAIRDLRGTVYLKALAIYDIVFFALAVWNCGHGTTKVLAFCFQDNLVGPLVGVFTMPLLFVACIIICVVVGGYCLLVIPGFAIVRKMLRYLFPWYFAMYDAGKNQDWEDIAI